MNNFFCLGDTAQKLAYVLSNVALIEITYHVFGIGSSFSSMDLTGVALAQIKKTLEDIKKMVEIILSAPLKTAVDKTLSAMNLLENEQISRAVKEFEGAKDDAQTAFHFAKGQGNELDHLRQVSTATRIILLAKLCIYSYDENSHTIEPFYVLDDKKQKAIAIELERDCKNFLEYHRTVQVGFFSLKKDSKQEELQSIKNELLKIAYPYISEGKKYTCISRRLEECFEFKYDSDLIPDGFQNATVVKLGIRKKDNSKITESFYKSEYRGLMYKLPRTAVMSILSKKITKADYGVVRLFKNMTGRSYLLGLKFTRTTDEMPIFYTKDLAKEVMVLEVVMTFFCTG